MSILRRQPDSHELTVQLHAAATAGWIRRGDLREVFCVLAALQDRDPGLLDGARLAAVVQRLIACEAAPGGPYYSRQGVLDPVANHYVSYFFSRRGMTLPALTAYLATAMPCLAGCEPPRPGGAAPSRQMMRALELSRLNQRASVPAMAAPLPPYHERVLRAVGRQLAALPPPLRPLGARMWSQFKVSGTLVEIIGLPHMVYDSLRIPPPLPPGALERLSVANVFGWMATVIYDDFIDEEGEPAMLPFANAADRLALAAYERAMPDQPGLLGRVNAWNTAVDAANAWEVAHARATVHEGHIVIGRLPRYGHRTVLADRAFGHTIGSMLLVVDQPGVSGPAAAQLHRALCQYLIARQLNDDLHDWRKDLRAGQLNAVLTGMLHSSRLEAGTYELDELVARLEYHFMRHGLGNASRQILRHAAACRRAFAASRLLRPAAPCLALVDRLEGSARQALQLQRQENRFLHAYAQAS